jgi:hypothetical protein
VHQKVVLYQVGNTKGPEPQEAKQVTFPDKIGPKLVTLRLIVPDFYRKAFLANDQKDTPTTAIGSWAKQLNIPASSLTGGNWQELNLKHGKMMIAHIRTTADIAQKPRATVVSKGSSRPRCPAPIRLAIKLYGYQGNRMNPLNIISAQLVPWLQNTKNPWQFVKGEVPT